MILNRTWQHCSNNITAIEVACCQIAILGTDCSHIEVRDRNPFLLLIMACMVIKIGTARGDIISDAECNLEAYMQRHRSRYANHDILAWAIKQ